MSARDAGAKRRAYTGPALFSVGFRPFFLGATLFAGLAVLLWLGAFAHGAALGPQSDAMSWHAHEMIFGFIGAVVAGFLLTAVPNWTGRAPVMGMPLAMLFTLWLGGRGMMLLSGTGTAGRIFESLFLVTLALAIGREVLAGRNWRNLPVCVLVTLFALANMAWHAEALGLLSVAPGTGKRMALAVVTVLMSLVGGRIIPSFTTNWMKKQKLRPEPTPFGWFDQLALVTTVAAMVIWVGWPDAVLAGSVLTVAATLHFVRLLRWQGWRTRGEPLVLILHIAYGWIVVALAVLATNVFVPGLFAGASALHALTAGAIGQLTLAVMTRASLGHVGRPLTADRATVAIYALVFIGAVLRLVLPFTSLDYALGASIAGTVWAAGFLLFAAHYGPVLVGRRPPTRPASS